MSTASLRLRRQRTRLCLACQARKARFRFRGEVRADRDHTLCFECYRGQTNRARARRLRERLGGALPRRMPDADGGPGPWMTGTAAERGGHLGQ